MLTPPSGGKAWLTMYSRQVVFAQLRGHSSERTKLHAKGWARPGSWVPFQNNPPCNGNEPAFNTARSYQRGGVNALMGDGRLQFFKRSISAPTWRALSTTTGGEVISADSY